MKKITLFLSVLLMAIGVNAQRTLVSSWDFAALAAVASNDQTPMTYSNETVKVGGTDSNLGTGDYEGLAMQGAGSFVLRTGQKAIENRNGGNRKIGVLNLVKDQIITITASTTCLTLADVTTAIEQSVTTADGKTTYVYVMLTDGMLALSNARNTFLYSIVVENPDPNVVPVTGITLDKSIAEITEGMVLNLLTATVAPANATIKAITWTSSNETVATVSGGQITGVAPGTTTITAEVGGFTATCEVTVKEKVINTSWDFAALYDAGAKFAWAVNSLKLGGQQCNYAINEFEGLAVQGDKWSLYYNKNKGLYQGNGGARNIGILNLKNGSVVTVIVSEKDNSGNAASNNAVLTLADASNAEETSKEIADGKIIYVYTMTADGTLVLNMTRYFTIFSIGVKEQRILTVVDGEDLDAEGTYDAATYTRTVNTAYNYGTICLPFAPDAETCAKYTFYALDSYGANALVFTKVDAPVANTAYLYCAADKQITTHTFTGGETTVSNEIAEPVGDYKFIGVLTKKVFALAETDGTFYVYKPTEENGYKDVFGKAVGTTMTVKPYRAYIHAAAAAQSLATMRIVVRGQGDNGDGTTAIEEVITPDQIEGAVSATIYNLMGQPVAQPVKGQIYIVNGQKVVY